MIRIALPLLAMLGGCAAGPAPVQAPLAPGGGWSLVFADEFDGAAIDPAKWSFDVNCWGGGNKERQCYTDSPRNAFVDSGILNIVARHESATGFALPESQRAAARNPDATKTQPFTSARMVTRGKAAWKYGRVEVRARLPQGQGTWPAIWMLPEDWAYGPWAASGEIDILEAVNLGVPCAECAGGREDTILGTLHFGGPPPDNVHKGEEVHYPPVLDGFHTYALEWSDRQMVWTVDGREFARRTADEWRTTASRRPGAPFDQPFHLILNLAIGGGLPESRGLKGVSADDFPKAMQVDWVRVWQCAGDMETGRACMSR